MPEVNTKLVTNLRHARAETKESPWWFAFVAKGTTDGMLLIGKMKIPTKEINEAKAACGGKQVFRGRCFGEGEELICEVGKEPPPTLDKQVKAIIHRDAGLQLKVEFRVAHDLALEEREGAEAGTAPDTPAVAPPPAPTPPPTAPPGDGAARFMARLKVLLPDIQKAEAANHPLSPEVKLHAGEAQEFARQKDFDQANGVLDKLETLVKQVLAQPVGTAPSAPPSPAGNGAARFMTRLKALAPEIKRAEGENSLVSQEIKRHMSEADAFAHKHDFTQANVLLDQIESLLRQAPPGPPPSLPPDAAKAAVMKRLGALAESIKAALAGPNKARVHEFVLQIEGLIKGNEFVTAGKVLDELEPVVKRGPVEEATATTAKGKFVLMQQARLAWNRIRDDVMAELVSIEQEIIQKCAASNDDPDEEFEVDLEEVKTGTKTLYKLIDQLNTNLLDQLDETLNKYSDESLRAEGYKVAARLVTDFKNTLSADPLLNRVDNNGFKQTKIKATVVGILDYLISKLA